MYKFMNLERRFYAPDAGGQGGTLVNATTAYTNAYTGATTAFTNTDSLSVGMKTYYDTELLENTRAKLIYEQLGRRQTLPAHHGRIVEWFKWNKLPDVQKLTEAVIPVGQKLGMTNLTVEINQYGDYVAVSDLLELHYIDNVILGATEELGAAAGETYDKLVRNVLSANTNVLYADILANGAYSSTPSTRAALAGSIGTTGQTAYVTPDMINKAVTALKKQSAPFYSGNNYVAVIHPSCTYDLRSSAEWLDVHKYAQPDEIFNGEIGKLHGVRFIESMLAPVIESAENSGKMIYQTMIFGKDAFGVIDPAGAGMETIVKSKEQVGGPLNQFSTIGTKFEMAAKILYPERMLILESTSSYSTTDAKTVSYDSTTGVYSNA